ncbi:DMT family transporter [Alsobacter sp. KACC 23698]|uniref:DMT family transporter n=1 Tax=Alsobacter sp. KACC 23698 TaxID=3149229 RepID=A0AAU7JB95_9HYPH
MAVSTTAAIPALFVFALLREGPLLPATARGWLVVVALGVVCHVAGQGLIARSLAALPATFSSMVLLVQPVAAALLAWLFFAEALTLLQAVGMLTVLSGIVLARRAIGEA